MPAPAVYIFAGIATVGAIWAFKELVYDPHLHPRVVSFVDELHDNKRRRNRGFAQPYSAYSDSSDTDSDEDSSQPSIPLLTPVASARQLQHDLTISLRRRRQQSGSVGGIIHDSHDDQYGIPYARQLLSPSHGKYDVELSELAPETQERNQTSDVGMSPLDESNHTIEFVPLQLSRGPSPSPMSETHVIANPDSPASTTSAITPTGSPCMNRSVPQLPQEPHGPSGSVLFSTNDQQEQVTEPEAIPTTVTGSNAIPDGATSPVHQTPASDSASPTLPLPFVPSLSQIYPQNLDSEQGVILLSPPSSRSDSPFSVVSGVSSASAAPSLGARANVLAGGEQSDPRTPGSTATDYLSLADDSSAPSTPTSPSSHLAFSQQHEVLGHTGPGSDAGGSSGDNSDFDIISDTTSLSALNSPMHTSSPFSMSPFTSPHLEAQVADQFQHQHHDAITWPTSPAASTTSNTSSISDLEFLEHDGPWENFDHSFAGHTSNF